jgi:NTE family protein
MAKLVRRPGIGLALSGGGARGLAHIGVLKVFDRENIPIDFLAGTSAGGLVGSLYAVGHSPEEIENDVLDLTAPRQLVTLVDRVLPRRGLLKGSKVLEYLNQWLGDKTFEQLDIPFAVVAVDLNTGTRVMINEGKLVDAVRATIAFPGVFAPIRKGDQLLVDGGLLDNLPTDVARALGADVVIAVDVATDERTMAQLTGGLHSNPLVPDGLADLVEVLWRSMMVMTGEINRHCLEKAPPDLLIDPPLPPGITTFTGIDHAAEAIEAGEKAMEAALPELNEIISTMEKPLGRLGTWLKREVFRS